MMLRIKQRPIIRVLRRRREVTLCAKNETVRTTGVETTETHGIQESNERGHSATSRHRRQWPRLTLRPWVA